MNGRPERSTRSLWLRGGRRCRPCHQQVPASQSLARLPPPVDLLEAVLTLHRQSKPPLSSTAAVSSTYLYKYRPVCLIERGVHQSYHYSFAKTTTKHNKNTHSLPRSNGSWLHPLFVLRAYRHVTSFCHGNTVMYCVTSIARNDRLPQTNARVDG